MLHYQPYINKVRVRIRILTRTLAYTETHSTDSLTLAQTYYYAGRVYSRLHDYPAARDYYQQALDVFPSGDDNLPLRAVITHHIGKILRDCKMYRESLPYAEESLRLNRMAGNREGEYQCLNTIGYIYYSLQKFDEAEVFYKEALKISGKLTSAHRAYARVNLSDIKYYQGDLDSALIFIRHSFDSVAPNVRSGLLASAARVYAANGIIDSAYMCADQLVSNPKMLNRHIGYEVLLSSQLRPRVSIDSLLSYINEYKDLLSRKFETNSSELVINRQNYYDYSKHDVRRVMAEKEAIKVANEKRHMSWWLMLSLAVNISLVAYIIYRRRYRGLSDARKDLAMRIAPTSESEEASRQKCRDDLLKRLDALPPETVASLSDLADADVSADLRTMADNKKVIPNDSDLWLRLQQAVLLRSPRFLSQLSFLSDGAVSESEIHTALLIRAGIRPSEMEALLALSKGAVGARRAKLSQLVFGTKLSPTALAAALSML